MTDNNNLQNEQKVLLCLYCGNKTRMDMVGQHTHHWESDDESFRGYDKHKMFACPVCGKVTFHLAYWEDGMYGRNHEMLEEEKILYPINSIDGNAVPIKIRNAYEAALKNRNIANDTCLLALRKTLEVICEDKGAVGKDLYHKVANFRENGVFPESIYQASEYVRELGNRVAHNAGFHVSIHDVDTIIDFVEHIIVYLYALPQMLERFERRFKVIIDNNSD